MDGLIGRDREVGEVGALVEACRLVTLTGAPGVGKSRLALELARELAEGYSGGAWLVELAPLVDGALVPGAVAVALSVSEVPGQGLADTVAARIGERRALVVLDNCEHLIGACAKVVEVLLGGCPALRILATSREPLEVAGEVVWSVPPLAVPDRRAVQSPEELMGYGGVCLFVARACGVEPAFALNSYVGTAVAEICRGLDGIPLAIELAAGRVDVLTPAEIVLRLGDRFGLLTRGSREVLPRHQTLLAALDWSHDLLSMSERAMLRRASVFVGSFALEAAETVCADGDMKAGEVRELLNALASKSLVSVDADRSSEVRYRLLETIRAYASDKLEEAGEASVLREGHARFYLHLAETLELGLTGPAQARLLERLDVERENLRRGLEWSMGHGYDEWALRLAGSLVLFWRVRCHFSEGRELLKAALSASDAKRPALRARALWGAGFLTLMAGDPDGALPLLEQSLCGFREQNDLQGCARALLVLANCKQYRDESALPLLEESAALARDAQDRWCLAHVLAIAGFEHERHGELPAARVLFEECLAVAREAQDDQGLRFGLLGLGSVALQQGDYQSAESLLEEAVVVTAELGEDYSKAETLERLGELALCRGDYDRGRKLLEDGLALIPGVAPRDAASGTLVLLARVAHAAGDRDRARLLLDELTRDGIATPVIAVQCMGEMASEEGHPDDGRRLFGEVLARARAVGHKGLTARALNGLGRLAQDAGDARQAAALHNEALELQRATGAAPSIVASIEALAGLAAAAGCHHHAARLLGAASTHRQENGYARLPWESAGCEADLALVRAGLGAADFEKAFADGGELSLEGAAVLASKGAGRRGAPSSGWASLTAREWQVAQLAAQGLTNPEIATRLVITRSTVKYHLLQIFSKLGISRRGDLARDVWRRGGSTGSRDGD